MLGNSRSSELMWFLRAWHPCLQVNKAADKYEKQMKAAKKSGSKAKQDKVGTCL